MYTVKVWVHVNTCTIFSFHSFKFDHQLRHLKLKKKNMSTNFCTECNKYLELIIKYFRKLSIKFIGTYTHYNVCSPL